MTALFASAGLSSSGYIAAIIVAPLIAEDLLGSAALSGLPSAFTVIGMAIGSTVLATRMAVRGRRSGLILGYTIVAGAAVLAFVATNLASFALFSVAMFTLGAGHSANRLTRYAASDLYQPEHRASAISWVLWAGTIASVVGPALLEPAGRLAVRVGAIDTSGAYLVAIVAALSAVLVLRIRMPALVPTPRGDRRRKPAPRRRPTARGARHPDRAGGARHLPGGDGAAHDDDAGAHPQCG